MFSMRFLVSLPVTFLFGFSVLVLFGFVVGFPILLFASVRISFDFKLLFSFEKCWV
jgi:hypothetical protein